MPFCSWSKWKFGWTDPRSIPEGSAWEGSCLGHMPWSVKKFEIFGVKLFGQNIFGCVPWDPVPWGGLGSLWCLVRRHREAVCFGPSTTALPTRKHIWPNILTVKSQIFIKSITWDAQHLLLLLGIPYTSSKYSKPQIKQQKSKY